MRKDKRRKDGEGRKSKRKRGTLLTLSHTHSHTQTRSLSNGRTNTGYSYFSGNNTACFFPLWRLDCHRNRVRSVRSCFDLGDPVAGAIKISMGFWMQHSDENLLLCVATHPHPKRHICNTTKKRKTKRDVVIFVVSILLLHLWLPNSYDSKFSSSPPSPSTSIKTSIRAACEASSPALPQLGQSAPIEALFRPRLGCPESISHHNKPVESLEERVQRP